MAKLRMLFGKKDAKLGYTHVELAEIVGKTVQGVGRTTVEGEYGDEPCVMLLFTDGTKTGFVLPGDATGTAAGLPEPKRRGKVEPHRLTVRVPVEVAFSTDPAELADREGEKKPTKKDLIKYLKDAIRLDIDTEDAGQPDGAVFAAAGIDWGKAELGRG